MSDGNLEAPRPWGDLLAYGSNEEVPRPGDGWAAGDIQHTAGPPPQSGGSINVPARPVGKRVQVVRAELYDGAVHYEARDHEGGLHVRFTGQRIGVQAPPQIGLGAMGTLHDRARHAEVDVEGQLFVADEISWAAGAAAEVSSEPDPEPPEEIVEKAKAAAEEIGCTATFARIGEQRFLLVETGRGTIKQRYTGSWPITLQHVGLD